MQKNHGRFVNRTSITAAFFAMLGGTTLSHSASAAVFSITNRTTTSNPLFATVLTAIDSAVTSITSTLNNSIFSETNRSGFLTQMANAGVAANKGQLHDYGSNPSIFTVGVGATGGFGGLNALASGATTNGLPAVGVSLQPSIHFGLNLGVLSGKGKGMFSLDRLTIGGNFFSYNLALSGFGVNSTNFAIGAQYKLIEGAKIPFVASWGGLDIGVAYSYNTSTISYATPFSLSQPIDTGVAGESVTAAWSANLDLGVRTTSSTIPLEISTNATFLYLFTGYLGMGLDFNFGSSKLVGGVSGPFTVTYTGSLTAPSDLYSATGVIDLDSTEAYAMPLANVRMFAGIQMNFLFFKPYFQYHYTTSGVYMFATGLRVAI